MIKVCTKCNIEKTIDEYYKVGKKKNGDIKYRSDCKSCQNQYNKQYHQDNKEHISKREKQYRQDNKERIIEYGKQYYQENKEHIIKYSKQYRQKHKKEISIKRKQYHKQYRQNHKEERKQYNKQYRQNHKKELSIKRKQYNKIRRSTDLEFKLKDNVRVRINNAIHRQLGKNTKKSACTHELLGISMDKYIRWIEFQLKDSWTWDNWGSDFHIDHVYPIAAHDLSKKEKQFKAFNWKNTRPLCKKKNASKSDKIIPREVNKHKVVVLAFLFRERLFYS